MEKLYLSYNGSRVTYYKGKSGDRSIELPVSIDKAGNYTRNMIELDSIGWKISTKPINGDEPTSIVWITNDGEIAFSDSQNGSVGWLGEKIDPDKQTDSPIYKRAQKLYDVLQNVVGPIVAYENAPWTPEQVIELRKKQLSSFIKMLGYDSLSDIAKREEPNAEYALLTRVGRRLEDYRSLTFVKNDDLTIFGKFNYTTDIPEFYQAEPDSVIEDGEENKTKSATEVIDGYSKVIDKTEADFEEDLLFIRDKNEYLERSRAVLDDYFVNMKRRVPQDEWQKYYGVVLRTARLVMGLNYDIIPEELREGLIDYSGLSRRDIEDKISNLIDSRDFAIASDIENRYASQETVRLEERIDNMQQEQEALTRGELARALQELKDEALRTRTEKQQKMSAYNEMDRIIKAKQIVIPRNQEFKEGE